MVAGRTSTGPSGCGPRPARPPAIWSGASKPPTRGAPTATSGSTFRTTRGTRSALTPMRTRPPWPTRPPTWSEGHPPPCGLLGTMSSSRRAGPGVWRPGPAIRQLGRIGIAELVERCCALARRFASQLDAVDGVEIGNDVVLNQVLVRFGDDDTATDRVVAFVQQSGECWMGTTTWRGRRYMRISVSSWRTSEEDVDRSVAAIVTAARS